MGTAAISFVPISGAHADGPLCYLLEVDGFRMLLDCGWDDRFDPATIEPLKKVVGTVDAVLLSHPDTAHLGAIPYLVGRAGLEAPIYGTLPVHKMGQMFMYDHFLSRQACSDFDLFNLDDVDNAFTTNFHTLRYQQNMNLQGKGEGIQITPYPAGHLVGGTIWRISKEGEDILYAVDYNNKKERHLNGCVLESFSRPALMITDAFNAALAPSRQTRQQRDREFVDAIMGTLRRDGNVLIPCDSAGRVLELLLLLDGHWAANRLGSYPLVFLTAVAYNTMEFAKSMIEWMADTVSKSFEHSRDNAFACRYVNLCHGREELNGLPAGPKVVLASAASLESGAARGLLVEWGGDPRNLVLFTERPAPGTLASELLGRVAGDRRLKVAVSRRVPLEGEELEAHLAQERRKEEEEEEGRKAAEAAAAAASGAGGGEGAAAGEQAKPAAADAPEGPPGGGGAAGGGSARGGRAPAAGVGGGTGAGARQTTEVLVEGFGVPDGAAAPMFTHSVEARAWDEYGEVVDLAPFTVDGGDGAEGDMDLDPGRAMEAAMQPMAEDGGPGAEAAEMGPSKIAMATMTVNVQAEVRTMDFEGRADARSMRTLLAHVAPRQLILVNGTPEASAALAAAVEPELPRGARVHTPTNGEEVVAASTASSFLVDLPEGVMSRVRFHAMGDYQLAWVDGELVARDGGGEGAAAGGGGEDGGASAAKDGGGAAVSLHLPEEGLGAGAAASAHKAVMVGSAKLGDLKQALAAAGVPAEIRGGVLLCGAGGCVTVRRPPGGSELLVEGALSEDYYRVRELVYSQYHMC